MQESDAATNYGRGTTSGSSEGQEARPPTLTLTRHEHGRPPSRNPNQARARARVNYREMVGTRDSREPAKTLARRVLAEKAAGSMKTHDALARATGVDPAAVSRLRAEDGRSQGSRPQQFEALLRFSDSLPPVAYTHEGPVGGESAKERTSRCSRNYRRRMAALSAARKTAEDQAAQARRCVVCLTDGSDVSVDGCPHVFCEGCIVQWCYYRQQTTCPTCRAPVREIRSLETCEVLHEFIGPRTTSALICEKAFALKQRALKQCVEAAESMEAAESGAADARSDIGAVDNSGAASARRDWCCLSSTWRIWSLVCSCSKHCDEGAACGRCLSGFSLTVLTVLRLSKT